MITGKKMWFPLWEMGWEHARRPTVGKLDFLMYVNTLGKRTFPLWEYWNFHRGISWNPTLELGVGTCPTAHCGKTTFTDVWKYIGKTYFPTVGILEFPPWCISCNPTLELRVGTTCHGGETRFPDVWKYSGQSYFPTVLILNFHCGNYVKKTNFPTVVILRLAKISIT